jgi:hypothetical protein
MDGRAWSSRCILLPTPLGLPGSRSLLSHLSRQPSVDIRDQPIHRAPHQKRIVQGRQWIRVFAGGTALAPAPDPAQFGSFVGIGMEKAEAARGGSGPAGLARLRLGLTPMVFFNGRQIWALFPLAVSEFLVSWVFGIQTSRSPARRPRNIPPESQLFGGCSLERGGFPLDDRL